jgi:hypothetical protein
MDAVAVLAPVDPAIPIDQGESPGALSRMQPDDGGDVLALGELG